MGAPHKHIQKYENFLNNVEDVILISHCQGIYNLVCDVLNGRAIRNENTNIGIDNSQLLYRVDAVFVVAIVMQDNVDNKNGNELTH